MQLNVKHLHKAFGGKTVLEDVCFTLSEGQKVGFVGNNGSGKSTLLKILAGEMTADSGDIQYRQGLRVGYLPQDTSLAGDEIIRQYILRVSGMQELEQNARRSAAALSEFEYRDGYTFEHRMAETLAGLGFTEDVVERSIGSLSSGQKSKVFMAAVLLSDPGVLLLDEPTNNLDLPALIWLETFLHRSNMACIVVSHDRLFLDRLVRKIMVIDAYTHKITITGGRYSNYLQQIEKERARQFSDYEAQQEEIRRLTESAQAQKSKAARGAHFQGSDNDKFARGAKRDRAARFGGTAKAIERRIEQMERITKPVTREALQIRLQAIPPEGSNDIVLEDVIASYNQTSFRIGPLSGHFPYGSRTVIVGLNGSGKSTLLRTISGELEPKSGKVIVGSSLVIGNLMQEHDNLPRDKTLKEYLLERAHVPLQDAFRLAVRHGFSADEVEKKISALSPGGRARLLFAAFSALSVNVLLLDEPTNHLDLEALDALDEMVAQYTGTIILVSHDRYFLEKFFNADIFVLTEGKLVRQHSIRSYITATERDAKRLIARL